MPHRTTYPTITASHRGSRAALPAAISTALSTALPTAIAIAVAISLAACGGGSDNSSASSTSSGASGAAGASSASSASGAGTASAKASAGASATSGAKPTSSAKGGGSGAAATAGAHPTSPAIHVVTITIKGTTVTPKPAKVTVAKGSQVFLVIASDRSATVKITGAGVAHEIAAGKPLTLPLTLKKAGVYPVELQGPVLLLTQLVVK